MIIAPKVRGLPSQTTQYVFHVTQGTPQYDLGSLEATHCHLLTMSGILLSILKPARKLFAKLKTRPFSRLRVTISAHKHPLHVGNHQNLDACEETVHILYRTYWAYQWVQQVVTPSYKRSSRFEDVPCNQNLSIGTWLTLRKVDHVPVRIKAPLVCRKWKIAKANLVNLKGHSTGLFEEYAWEEALVDPGLCRQ